MNKSQINVDIKWLVAHLESLKASGKFEELRIESPDKSVQFDAACLGYFAEARQLMIAKEKDYGSTWLSLGAKGIWVYLQAKTGRLKQLVWKKQAATISTESARDTYIGLLNYVLMSLYCLDTENYDGT